MQVYATFSLESRNRGTRVKPTGIPSLNRGGELDQASEGHKLNPGAEERGGPKAPHMPKFLLKAPPKLLFISLAGENKSEDKTRPATTSSRKKKISNLTYFFIYGKIYIGALSLSAGKLTI